jgi:hypothetical protein
MNTAWLYFWTTDPEHHTHWTSGMVMAPSAIDAHKLLQEEAASRPYMRWVLVEGGYNGEMRDGRMTSAGFF